MIDLSRLEPVARKLWVKKKWDEYTELANTKAIKRSIAVYEDPTAKEFDNNLDRSKWKSTVDKKVNYLLARKPLCTSQQERLDALLDFIRDSATQYILKGSLIWIVQGNGVDIDPMPLIMNNTIAIYSDEFKENAVAFIRKFVDIELDPKSGAETEREYFECYYMSGSEQAPAFHRDTWCYSIDNRDKEETLPEKPMFVELGKTGDAPLFAYVEGLLRAFDNILKHQDRTTEKNTKALVEVRGYSGTDEADLEYAVDTMGIVKTDGNGGVTVHTRSMDSNSIDIWAKRLLQEYYEATCTVGKDNELVYAQSGKAMDRLFIDMENSARELAHVLEQALKAYFESIGAGDVDIVWNTDRPVDEASIISSIVSSRGLLSDKTLIEQHPWVEDVEEELRRLEEQNLNGMEDLVDMDVENNEIF